MHIFFKKIIFILEIWRIICIQLMYIKNYSFADEHIIIKSPYANRRDL